MRISTAYQYDTYANNVRMSESKYFDAQNAVMTGKRINKISDDPFGTSVSLNMRSYKAAAKQYSDNLTVGKGVLSYTESALDEMTTAMRTAYSVAIQAGTDTMDQSARDSLASQIDSLQKQLLELANTQGPSGQYIFAGQANDSKPFTVTATAGSNALALSSGLYLNFNGDDLDVTVESGPGQTLAVNVKAQNLIKNAYAALDQLKVDLQGGNVSAISGVDIENIKNSMNAIIKERGNVGTKLQSVQTLTDHYTRRIDDLTTTISDVEEVDLSEAIMNYKLAYNAYNAALSVASQGYQLSLLDFIK